MGKELKLSYEKNFSSQRPDGRYVCTMAAHMAMLRNTPPRLALPKSLTEETFSAWQNELKDTLKKQLRLPTATVQPPPKYFFSNQREGYRTEKWEFYPDDYSAVPFLVLIPDRATPTSPQPAVMCYLDACENKEYAAGEPLLQHPNCQQTKGSFPFAAEYAKNGIVTFVFDNPGIAECSVFSDPSLGETQSYIREILCHGLLESGMGYLGLTVFQRIQFMKWLDSFPYVDKNRLAIAAHGLGTEAAVSVGLLEDNIRALVFGNILKDPRQYYVSATEQNEQVMAQDIGKWHILPGKNGSFGYQDLCAAFAPRHLYLCNGSNEDLVNTVRRAYSLNNAESSLFCESSVKCTATLALKGLHKDEIYSPPTLNFNEECRFLKNALRQID